jgi:hypothetical protein
MEAKSVPVQATGDLGVFGLASVFNRMRGPE